MAILVDNTPREDGRQSIKSQVSDIQEARNYLKGQNTILTSSAESYNRGQNTFDKNFKDFNDALETLTENIKKKSESTTKADKEEAKAIQRFLSSIGMSEDSMNKLSQQAKLISAKFKDMYENGNASGESLVDMIHALDDTTESLGAYAGIIEELNNSQTKFTKKVKDNIKELSDSFKIQQEKNRRARSDEKTEYMSKQKIAGQDVGKAVKEEIGKLGDNLGQLMNTLNINKIAEKVAVSAKQQLQGELQTNYNLNKNEFEKFKHDLYGQIDTSIYTTEEVNKAMETLNTTALGNTQTATKYFNDIIRGQKVLGLTSETQQQLLKLGNITGRNELAFYQGTVAKFLNSSLGLNKQQLNELVQMNANLATQAADLGIATEEFEKMNVTESGAMEKTATGFGSKFTQMESTLLANTNTTASLLGMDSGELSERLARGESLIDILKSGAGSSEAINVLRNGSVADQTRMFEFAKEAWGVDTNTWSVLRVIAQQTEELNDNLLTATEASAQDTEKVVEEATKKQTESLTILQKAVNSATNWINDKIPWTVEATLASILVGVTTIIGLLKIGGNISEISKSLLKDGDTKLNIAKSLFGANSALGGTKGISKWSWGNGTVSKVAKVGGAIGIASGLIGGVSDLISMQGSENSGFGSAMRGFFLGTGSKQKTSEENAQSFLGNAGKWGAIGAGVGTFIGGPLGTLIGGGLGAVAGGIASLVGINRDNKRLQEEQKSSLNEIKQNTATTAYNTSAGTIGAVYRYRGTDNYSSSIGAIGNISGGGYCGYIARGPIGAMEDAGKPITSYWRQKRTYKATDGKWYTDEHNGADFGASEGTPLYSNATGTVTMNFTEKSGANIVGVTDSSGYTHIYAHMREKSPLKVGTNINKGDFVGYVGKTGKVTGAHLHYTVLRPGEDARKNYWKLENTVDPGPFVSSSIFNGDASTVVSSANSSNINSSVVQDIIGRKSSLITLENIGSISGPVVNSITDLKQTIIDLSNRTEQNEKILNMLTNRTQESPIV